MDVEIEYNEQRVRDVEIPLHKLEQKVQQLESHVINYNLDEITNTVIAKINQNLKETMPRFWRDLNSINKKLDDKSKIDT